MGSLSIDFMHVRKNKTPNICSLAERVENQHFSAQLVTASPDCCALCILCHIPSMSIFLLLWLCELSKSSSTRFTCLNDPCKTLQCHVSGHCHSTVVQNPGELYKESSSVTQRQTISIFTKPKDRKIRDSRYMFVILNENRVLILCIRFLMAKDHYPQ